MALPSFCRDEVAVMRAPLVDARGTEERDWAHAAEHVVSGCSVQFAGTSGERGEARVSAVSDTATLYAPPGADVLRGDRISCPLGVFDVEGTPMPHESPTGAVSHIAVQLSRWKG